MSDVRGQVPPEEARRVIEALAEYTQHLVGERGVLTRDILQSGLVSTFHVEPKDPRARRIAVIGEQSLIVCVGDVGGRWELGYGEDDVVFARDVIESTIAGRVCERRAIGRSRVTVTLSGGEPVSDVGYEGGLTSLLVQPGWTAWGKLIEYAPYRPTQD